MIAKYDRKCFYCKQPAKAGFDIYDTVEKKTYHQRCHDSQPTDLFSASEADELAARLGLIGPD